jgi:DNA-binding transcriptional MerR regulator
MRTLSISELESLSGVRREVIYFYVRRGLLPQAQKASATRAIYTNEHVDLLRQIEALKDEGLTLEAVKDRLADQIGASQSNGVDLAADQVRQRRDAILQEAARQFAQKGYRRTRIVDIVRALAMTPQQLYGFFPTKRHLFVACYNVFVGWMGEQVEPRAGEETDPAAKLAWRLYANLGVQALSPEVQALAQVEALQEENDDLCKLVRNTYQGIMKPMIDDVEQTRPGGEPAPTPFSDELVSYALLGAFGGILMRTSWDEKYGAREAMQNLVGIYLAIEGVYQGRLDISERWDRLAGLIDRLSRLRPPGPPSAA